MKVAQELYEGMSLGTMGTQGLITYMRTDSLRVADDIRAVAKTLSSKSTVKIIILKHRISINPKPQAKTLTKLFALLMSI